MLSLWPPCADKRLGPAPSPGTHPYSHSHPVLSMYTNFQKLYYYQLDFSDTNVLFSGIEIQEFDFKIFFPPEFQDNHIIKSESYDFTSLDLNTQEQLLHIIYQDTFTR